MDEKLGIFRRTGFMMKLTKANRIMGGFRKKVKLPKRVKPMGFFDVA